MNEVRRARIKCDIDLLSCIRERIDKIRDDEDRALRGDPLHGFGNAAACVFLSEASQALMIVIDRMQRAKQCH